MKNSVQCIFAVAFCFLVAVPTSVSAQSLKEKQLLQSQSEDLAKELKYTNEKCGTDLKASIQPTGFSAADMESYSISGYCDSALGAIESVCGDDLGKESVKTSIKQVVCKKGEKRDITLSEGSLEFSIDFNASNDQDYVKEFLMNNL